MERLSLYIICSPVSILMRCQKIVVIPMVKQLLKDYSPLIHLGGNTSLHGHWAVILQAARLYITQSSSLPLAWRSHTQCIWSLAWGGLFRRRVIQCIASESIVVNLALPQEGFLKQSPFVLSQLLGNLPSWFLSSFSVYVTLLSPNHFPPGWGWVRQRWKLSHFLWQRRVALSIVLSLKPGVGHNIALHCSPLARNSAFLVIQVFTTVSKMTWHVQ